MSDTDPLSTLVEESIENAWNVLERSGEIDDPAEAMRILLDVMTRLVAQGERRRLMLVNRAIDRYRACRQTLAA